MRIYNDGMLGFPKPPRGVLIVVAVLFAVATVFYAFAWMYYIRWQPRIEPSGISYLESAQSDSLEIVRVAEGSAAAEAGLRAGDRVTAINGRPMRSLDPYFDLVARGKPGDHLDFIFARDGIASPTKTTVTVRPPLHAWAHTSWHSITARALANSYPVLLLVVGL